MARGVKLEITDALRAQVEALAGLGLTKDDIGEVLGVSGKTIERRFKKELAAGTPKATAKVAQNLFKQATKDSHKAIPAAIFWLKTRARWTTVEHVNVTTNGASFDGAPRLADLRNLSTEDLLALDEIAQRLEAARAEVDGEGNGASGHASRAQGRPDRLPSRN